jgi:hypothetical protein
MNREITYNFRDETFDNDMMHLVTKSAVNPALYAFLVVIYIILLIIYIIFYVGSDKILKDPVLSENSKVKNLTIALLVLISISLVISVLDLFKVKLHAAWGIVNTVLFVVNFILICILYNEIKKTDYAKYILPLLVYYAILIIIFVISLIYIYAVSKSHLD